MDAPDAHAQHDPDPERLRGLLKAAGLTMAQVAAACGMSVRTLERYLSPVSLDRGDVMPYPLQYTIEALCWHRTRSPPRSRRAVGRARSPARARE